MLSRFIPTVGISMAALSIDILFDAAIRIQLAEETISLTFTKDEIRIKFPTTRRLAEFLGVPHYYVLPYFAMMEQEELVTRAERVGILTTTLGSRKMVDLMKTKYLQETGDILGIPVFSEIIKKFP
jgi:Mn-dependent DtxR family transcriptional regulator